MNEEAILPDRRTEPRPGGSPLPNLHASMLPPLPPGSLRPEAGAERTL
jgi:hypothetical protein